MSGRALLVDDESAILLTLSAILEINGFVVQTASSAHDAKESLLASTFDLVITDLRMETPTAGYEVAALAAGQQPRPAIIILSAFPSEALDWKQHGAHAFFEKPASPAELLRTIDELLRNQDKGAAA